MRKLRDNLEAIREFKRVKLKKDVSKVQMDKTTEHSQMLKQTSIQVNLRVCMTKKRKSKQSPKSRISRKISRKKKLNFDIKRSADN